MRAVVLAGLVAVAVGLSACNETLDAHYNSLDAAKKEGAVQRGWIPRFAPPTATNIRERHDLDTNEVWGVLDFSAADATELRRQLKGVRVEEVGTHEPRRAGTDWWPAELVGPFDVSKLRTAGLEFFRESDTDFFAAVDWKRGCLYFWSKRL